ncbi:hypothetical protein [Paenibacillus crassostreae]|uniref:hypothetical protein n=1 Tax=Paenibacillus crassostreae TaxID=1763538 RepID=UPI0018E09294|nr:hypothetical protein [Paenibacillus crassostreae]
MFYCYGLPVWEIEGTLLAVKQSCPVAIHAAQERAAPQRMKMDTSVYTVCTAGEEGR